MAFEAVSNLNTLAIIRKLCVAFYFYTPSTLTVWASHSSGVSLERQLIHQWEQTESAIGLALLAKRLKGSQNAHLLNVTLRQSLENTEGTPLQLPWLAALKFVTPNDEIKNIIRRNLTAEDVPSANIRQSLLLLAKWQDETSLEAMVDQIKSPHRIVRESAAKALGMMANQKAKKIVFNTIEKDWDPWVRYEAIKAFGKLNAKITRRQRSILISIAQKGKTPKERIASAFLLAKSGDKEGREQLESIALYSLKTYDPHLKKIVAYIEALGDMGAALTLWHLHHQLGKLPASSPREMARIDRFDFWISSALVALGEKAAQSNLERFLTLPGYRHQALYRLANKDHADSLKQLREIASLKVATDSVQTSQVVRALNFFIAKKDSGVVPLLLQQTTHPNHRVIETAITGLGELGTTSVLNKISCFLNERYPNRIRMSAAGATLQIKGTRLSALNAFSIPSTKRMLLLVNRLLYNDQFPLQRTHILE